MTSSSTSCSEVGRRADAGPPTTHLVCDFGYLTLWTLSCQSAAAERLARRKETVIACHSCAKPQYHVGEAALVTADILHRHFYPMPTSPSRSVNAELDRIGSDCA